MFYPEEFVRCPKCKALVSTSAKECPECLLMDSYDDDQLNPTLEHDGPRNSVVRFFWGLGVTLDIWIVLFLMITWFFILCFAKSFGYAVTWTFIAFVIPFVLLLFSGPLSGLKISFNLATMDDMDPVAMKIFVWVYMIVAQGWLIYVINQ